MNTKLNPLNPYGLTKSKSAFLFLSLILIVFLSIYSISCSSTNTGSSGSPGSSGSSGAAQEGYATNSGTPIATFNQFDDPALDVSSNGRVAWAQETGDRDTIFSYWNQSASLKDQAVPTVVATVELCLDIATNNAGQIAWAEHDGNDFEIWLYSNGEIEQISNDQNDNYWLDLNGSGHIVWMSDDNESQFNINLYRNGEITRLTESNANLFPSINDNGQISWQVIKGDNLSICLRDNSGQVTKVIEKGEDAFSQSFFKGDWHGALSSSGVVVWQEVKDGALQIFSSSNGQVTQITYADRDSRFSDINGLDQIVWDAYDGSEAGDSEIFMYSNGTVTQLTDNDIFDKKPRINKAGQVVWEAYDGNDKEIFIYDNGTITQLTDNEIYDESPRICDTGQVFWLTKEPGEEDWYYTHIMTTLPGQETRAEPESKTVASRGKKTEFSHGNDALPPAGSKRVTTGEKADKISQSESPLPEPRVVPTPADPDNFTFVVFGDTRGTWTSWVKRSNAVLNYKFLNFMKAELIKMNPKPDLVFYGGDIATYCYPEMWQTYFVDNFVKPLRSNNIYVYPMKGNHECYKWGIPPIGNVYGKDRQTAYQAMVSTYFPWVPANGPSYHYNGLCYHFKYGNSFFVVYDTYFITAPRGGAYSDWHYERNIGPEQNDWQDRLGADYFNQFKHKFAFSHAPVFSVEGKKTDTQMHRMWHCLTARNFDIYFGAHTHLYSRRLIPRSFAYHPNYPGLRDMYQVVAGRGTESSDGYSVNRTLWNIRQVMNYVVVKVEGNTVTSTAYSVDPHYTGHGYLDSFKVVKP